jgi:hypothetical protein
MIYLAGVQKMRHATTAELLYRETREYAGEIEGPRQLNLAGYDAA